MKFVFMGTPEFAIPSLDALMRSHHQIQVVVTGPDKPVGRGQQLLPTPIKKFAIERGLPVLTPLHLDDEKFIGELRRIGADIFIVVAFRILPEAVFTLPSQGTVNLHGSLLPKYRGAAPIQWAIINGEKETGLTTFFIEKAVDTGEIILQRKMNIGPEETAGELHDRMSIEGARVLLETMNAIERGMVLRQKQIGEYSKAPKLTKELCHINWSKDVTAIYNLIRGLSPHPRALTYYRNQEFKVCHAVIESHISQPDSTPGEIIGIDTRGRMLVATGHGILAVLEIQAENKRRMTTVEYLRGHVIETGEILR